LEYVWLGMDLARAKPADENYRNTFFLQLGEWVTAVFHIFQLYYGENKLHFHWDDDDVHFELDKHA
jgi:hypothetical protein